MKKKLNLILIIAIAFGLVFPGGKVGFSAPKTVLAAAQASAFSAPSALSPLPVIITSLTSHLPQVSVNRANLSGCEAPALAADSLVQDAGIINLNQPATCFNLTVASAAASGMVLSVRPLPPQPTISVATVPFAITGPNVLPAPFPVMPLLPAAATAMLLGAVFIRRKLFASIKSTAQVFTPNIAFQRMQVLRC